MKQLSAILFGLLLAWVQLPAAPMPPAARPVHNCCACGGKMSCCAPASPASPPAPAIPSSAGAQNQLALLAPASLVWALPENEAGWPASSFTPVLPAAGVPLYTRDCARLI